MVEQRDAELAALKGDLEKYKAMHAERCEAEDLTALDAQIKADFEVQKADLERSEKIRATLKQG